MRHVGKIKNTDQRVVVVFMTLPDDEKHALVVATDSLPPRIEQALMHEVQSQEGQSDPVLANVLARRVLPDMGNVSILHALHTSGLLSKVPVETVIMYPQPNMPFPLPDVIEAMKRATGQTLPEKPQTPPEIPNAEQKRFNPYENTAANESSDDNKGKARGKLIEAELLEEEARRKREEAYRFDPSLRPRPVAVPVAEVAENVTVDETEVKTVKVKKPRASRKTGA